RGPSTSATSAVSSRSRSMYFFLPALLHAHDGIELRHHARPRGPCGNQVRILRAGEPEAAMKIAHQLCRDMQPEALPTPTHREERLEDVVGGFFGDPRAGICYQYPVLFTRENDSDPAGLPLGHRANPVTSVMHEVVQDLKQGGRAYLHMEIR